MRFLIGLLFVLFFPSSVIGQTDFGEYEGASFVGIRDGKTLILELPNYPTLIGQNIKVRIKGIAAPTLKGKCKKEKKLAKKVKTFLKSVLSNTDEINLVNMNRGLYFQIIADVTVDGQNLAELLVEEGYAVKISKKKKSHNWCK